MVGTCVSHAEAAVLSGGGRPRRRPDEGGIGGSQWLGAELPTVGAEAARRCAVAVDTGSQWRATKT